MSETTNTPELVFDDFNDEEVEALLVDIDEEQKKKKHKKKLQTLTSTQNFIPIRDIRQGIIITSDGRFVKLMEFSPVNFDLRSYDEQSAIIAQFGAVLRTMPRTLQFKVVTNKADTSRFINKILFDIETEPNEQCQQLQYQQIELIRNMGSASGLTRHFYVSFEYELPPGVKKRPAFRSIVFELDRQANNIRASLKQCGNEQISIDGDDEWTMSALFNILCRRESNESDFTARMVDVIAKYAAEKKLDFSKPITLPVNDFIAPSFIDPGSSPQYLAIDELYYCFGYITSSSYPVRALAGWSQQLINMGDGIDIDIWLHKEDPAQIRRKLQQKLKWNKVKMKDTSDTALDFDDLQSSIESGYYLKQGIASGDDFSYFGVMISVCAGSVPELNYKFTEIKNYCLRSDLVVRPCIFQGVEAFDMSLPLCKINPELWRKMRRNALVSQFACTYPFTSFEMSDPDGILLGTSQQNSSLVFVDPFDTRKYSNANMAILGASGSGKSYTLQCMALRMREKKIQVFIIAPLKGFEFARACEAVGGQYIKIAPGSGQNINIMEIRKMDDIYSKLSDGSSNSNESILAKKIQQLHAFFALLAPDITFEEKQTLDEAFINTYANFGITNKNRSLIDPHNPTKYKKMPVLGDLHKELAKLGEPAKRLHSILTRFVSGSASSFNSQTNVNLDNLYVVLDVSTLTDEMLPIGMFIALDYVWDKARESRTSRKTIFVDETWRLIGPGSSVLAAQFVLEIFKVIRGYGGSAVAATQDLNDFFALDNGRFGTGIINNSRIKLLLRPEPKEAETLSTVLELTKTEVERAKAMERGTCLLIANTNHIFITIKASRSEHDLITTDRNDLKRIEHEKQVQLARERKAKK